MAYLSSEPRTICTGVQRCRLCAPVVSFGCAAFVVFAADNGCTYNDPRAVEYVGRKHTNEDSMTCIMWSKQRAYHDSHFPDGSVLSAENFCRNPKPVDSKAWCYLSEDVARKWGYCDLRQCGMCWICYVAAENVLSDILTVLNIQHLFLQLLNLSFLALTLLFELQEKHLTCKRPTSFIPNILFQNKWGKVIKRITS